MSESLPDSGPNIYIPSDPVLERIYLYCKDLAFESLPGQIRLPPREPLDMRSVYWTAGSMNTDLRYLNVNYDLSTDALSIHWTWSHLHAEPYWVDGELIAIFRDGDVVSFNEQKRNSWLRTLHSDRWDDEWDGNRPIARDPTVTIGYHLSILTAEKTAALAALGPHHYQSQRLPAYLRAKASAQRFGDLIQTFATNEEAIEAYIASAESVLPEALAAVLNEYATATHIESLGQWIKRHREAAPDGS